MSEFNVLSAGVDTLMLSYTIHWENDLIFTQLKNLKEEALKTHEEYPGSFPTMDDDRPFLFKMLPYSNPKSGYQYILDSNLCRLRFTSSEGQGNTPECSALFRSELLWREGVKEAIEWITSMLEVLGAQINAIKVSRVDLCCDVEMPSRYWRKGIMEKKVTMAKKENDQRRGKVYRFNGG